MNRRDFLSMSTCGLASLAMARQLPIRRGRSRGGIPPVQGGGVGQDLLSVNDLTWLGTFKAPSQLADNGGTVAYPRFTLRRVNGVLKTLWLGTAFGGITQPDVLIQADYPGYDPVLANSPASDQNVRNFGNGFLPLCTHVDGTAISGSYTNGLHWDNHNNCLWIVFGENYNVTGTPDPVLIRGDINDSDPDATAVTWSGPWRLSGNAQAGTSTANSNQTKYYVVSVPPSYGTQYLSGATIALGAHGASGDAASSFNNTLWAPTVTPTSATPSNVTDQGSLAATCLIGGDIGSDHRGMRPGDYITESCGNVGDGSTDPTTFDGTQLVGRFNAADIVFSSHWIDWADKKGVIFLVSHGRGHLWYNSPGLQGHPGHCNHGVRTRYLVTGPTETVSLGLDYDMNPETVVDDPSLSYATGPDNKAAMYIYDPANFVPVAGGNPWDPQPSDWVYLSDHFPNFVIPKTEADYCQLKLNGLCADETSRLLMIPLGGVGPISPYGFYCNVFSVA